MSARNDAIKKAKGGKGDLYAESPRYNNGKGGRMVRRNVSADYQKKAKLHPHETGFRHISYN